MGPGDLVEELSLILGPPERTDLAVSGDLDLPAAGITLDELAAHWSLTMAEALTRLGRLELEGRVERRGDIVVPKGVLPGDGQAAT
jgi:predicted Rossmann fold nucleotide-binding protein DprA/Smf involved in DNA uptake